MRYRSKTEIIASLLEGTMTESSRTRLMFVGYLSFEQVKSYLSYMLETRLVTLNKNTERYKITDKGNKFLSLYYQMDALLLEGVILKQ